MSDIATSLISDDEREYLILQKRAISGADDGTYEWALNEIERLREALRLYQCQCEDGQCAVAFDDERGELCGMPARAALGEGKE